jgi:hypothetical protein
MVAVLMMVLVALLVAVAVAVLVFMAVMMVVVVVMIAVFGIFVPVGVPMAMLMVVVVVSMIVMIVMMVVGLFRKFDYGTGSAYPAALVPDEGELPAADAELLELRPQQVRVHAEIDEGAESHIARDAGEAIEVQGFHGILRIVLFMLPVS